MIFIVISPLLHYLQHFGLEGTGPVGIEVKKVLGDCVEIDNKSSDQYWSHGSAFTRGTNLNKTGDNCMQQIKFPSLNDKRESDGLFAMIDGGKSSDASSKIKKKMATIVYSEMLASEERHKDKELLYLEHSFLT
uniref:Uncharacterized protein n=1 Tax=Amphimedon queenslandica TaxID=400682 RepID=A0A1X7SUX5_AMPQE